MPSDNLFGAVTLQHPCTFVPTDDTSGIVQMIDRIIFYTFHHQPEAFFRFFHCPLRFHSFGRIAKDQRKNNSLRMIGTCNGGLDRKLFAGSPNPRHCIKPAHRSRRNAVFTAPSDIFVQLLVASFGEQQGNRFPDHFIGSVSKNPFGGGIKQNDRAVVIDGNDRIHRLLHDTVHVLFALLDRCQEFFLCGYR